MTLPGRVSALAAGLAVALAVTLRDRWRRWRAVRRGVVGVLLYVADRGTLSAVEFPHRPPAPLRWPWLLGGRLAGAVAGWLAH